MKQILIIGGLMTALFACKKAENRKCFKTAGGDSEKTVHVGTFHQLELGPHIRYVLVQDTVEKVVLSGGKNLLNFISTDVVDNRLVVKNKNKCNFLRSYKKEVKAEIHLKTLHKVLFEGTKALDCQGQLDLPYLTVVTRDGAGDFNLNVKSSVLSMVITNGWGNFNLTGETDYMKLDIRVNGSTDAYGLTVNDSLDVISTSSGLIKVNAHGAQFRAEVSSNGDIWYIGTPSSKEYNRYGEGELIDRN